MKVLILKPSSLGDIIHALPVARLFRRRFPDASIDWWILPGLAPLLEGDPDIRRTVLFDRKAWGKVGNWRLVVSAVRALRAEKYDLILDLQSLARTAIIGRLAGARRFVGLRDWREFAPVFHGESVPRPSYETHAVDWYLSVLDRLGVPKDQDYEWLPPRASGAAQIAAEFPELNSGRWIGLQPGARWENKRWPVGSYSQLVRLLEERHPGHRVAVFGAGDEKAFGRQIAAETGGRCLDLTGRLSLPGMIEGLRRMELLVTNDTGPMHVAVALGKPVVALFGPTDARRTGPYGQLANVIRFDGELPCAPCMKSECRHGEPVACLTKIDAARVASAVASRLGLVTAATL